MSREEWYSLTLTCEAQDLGRCALGQTFTGKNQTACLVQARKAGWSIGKEIRCKQHRWLRRAKVYRGSLGFPGAQQPDGTRS